MGVIMKIRKLCIFLICVSVLLSPAVSAQENADADAYRVPVSDGSQILLSGQPDSAIRELYIKSTSSDDWGINYLEQEGESLSPDPGGRYDLLIVGEDGVGYAFLDLPLTGSASCGLVSDGTSVRLSVSGDDQGTSESRDAVIWSDVPVKKTAQDSLRVRTSPSTDQNNAVAMLKPGETVDVYGETLKIGDHAWAAFRMDGEWRYVAADFLADAQETENTPSDGAADVPADEAADGAGHEEPADTDQTEGEVDEDSDDSEAAEDITASPRTLPDTDDMTEGEGQDSSDSEGFIGPVQQLPVMETEEIVSFLNPGTVYRFITYVDGSVSTEIEKP